MKRSLAVLISVLLLLCGFNSFAQEATDEVKKTKWTITATSEIISADKAIDSDTSTYWHSNYKAEGGVVTEKDPLPFTLEVNLGNAETVSGLRMYPRTDGSISGIVSAAELYLSADGKKFIKVGDIAYSQEVTNRAPRETLFSGNVKIKAFRYVITAGASNLGTVAELSLIKEKTGLDKVEIGKITLAEGEKKEQSAVVPKVESGSGKGERTQEIVLAENASFAEDEIVPEEGWSVHTTSGLAGGNGPAAAMDGDLSTFWHSYYESASGSITYKDTLPIDYTVVFPEATEISGIRYYPRGKEMSMSGIVKRATLYASDDGVSFYPVTGETELLYGAESESNYARTPAEISLPVNLKAKAVRFSVTASASGYAVASEIRVIKPNSQHKETLTAKQLNDGSDKYMMEAVDKSNISVTASSEQPYPFENQNDLDLTAVKTIDDNIFKSTWHTKHRNDDGSTAGFSENVMPAYLLYDFGKDYKISAVGYIPRSGFVGGHWIKLSVSTSSDGISFNEVGKYELNETQYKAFGRTVFYIEKPVAARYLKIDILSTADDSGSVVNRHAAANEIDFYETVTDKKEREETTGERYVLTVGSNTVSVKKGRTEYEKTIDAAPFISSGTTLIPLRGLFEEMGATVNWSGEDKKINVTAGNTEITFQIENTRVWVNGIRYSVNVAPRIEQESSRTFIPLRFVSERMGYKVTWDASNGTVTVEK